MHFDEFKIVSFYGSSSSGELSLNELTYKKKFKLSHFTAVANGIYIVSLLMKINKYFVICRWFETVRSANFEIANEFSEQTISKKKW